MLEVLVGRQRSKPGTEKVTNISEDGKQWSRMPDGSISAICPFPSYIWQYDKENNFSCTPEHKLALYFALNILLVYIWLSTEFSEVISLQQEFCHCFQRS